ncbi:2Fe-2S iron-sulfur cluster binding domain-containing protein [Marinomonas mediterranea]|uniref:2Fe-2S iron-sulfur cluster binding domain-containing protein n=1 Tax=Marinomonas mediterranea TaxID=119864 RepID=UPI0023497A23|nr:2Fe-2S iron-sulfur cluster binding domain-containing protein [Marinomonas mediterranea]WCN09530.1 2Fe-2S iron-sulfur cluster binding domain-containing protein [Marinomonas mediterranea]
MNVNLDGTLFQTEEEGVNLLSFLLERGVDIAYGCRAGACCSCRVLDLDSNRDLLACQTPINRSFNLSLASPEVESSPVNVNFVESLRSGTLLVGAARCLLTLGDKVSFDAKPDVWTVVGGNANGTCFWSSNSYASPLHYKMLTRAQTRPSKSSDSNLTSAFDGRVLLLVEPSLFELVEYIETLYTDHTENTMIEGEGDDIDLSAFRFQRFQSVVIVGQALCSRDWKKVLLEAKMRSEHLISLPLVSAHRS